MKLKNIIQKLLFLICFLQISWAVYAQKKYGNEWINYSKPYYKFHTPSQDQILNSRQIHRKDMVYTVSYTTIKNSGFPIDATDPRHIQVFTDGEETAIEIIGEEDGVFDAGDYIKIYSEHNDTRMDEPLFDKKQDIPMNMTLHGFQKAHFLSYTTDGTLGKRVQKISLPNNVVTTQSSHNNRMSSLFLRQNINTFPWGEYFNYGFGNISYGSMYPNSLVKGRLQILASNPTYTSYKNEARLTLWWTTAFTSHFTEGKGYVGLASGTGTTRTQNFDLVGIIKPEIKVKVRVAGLLNTPHHVRAVLEDEDGTEITLGDMYFNKYEIATLESTINSLNLTKSKNIKIWIELFFYS